MSRASRASLCLLALSLSLISPELAQSQSVPNPPAASELNEPTAALVRAGSEQEQDLVKGSLLAVLSALARKRL